ncbi:MAG: hypothetical protein IKL79_04280 [Clostridia bacterium]|nr:hypothetical protein [Clostridia bacterium]
MSESEALKDRSIISEAEGERTDAPSEESTADTAEAAAKVNEKEASEGGTPEAAEKKDAAERLREAGDTISRASAQAESLKRRREESGSSDATDAEKRREEEMKRLAEEEKKRTSAAEEKRAAYEYAESYRARIRSERESAASKKKEEEKARARAEERLARERELKADIEREREAARARGERAESLLERVGGDVSSVGARGESSADAFFDTPDSELPITADKSEADTRALEDTKATDEADVTPTAEEGKASAEAACATASTDKPADSSAPSDEADKDPTGEAEDKPEKPDDYVITVDGGHSERDLLYIEGAVACEIAIDTAPPAPSLPEKPAAVEPSADSDHARTAQPTEAPAPSYTSTPYGDFSEYPTKDEGLPEPAASDTERRYEEEAELARHSKESEAEQRAVKKEEKQSEDKVYPDPEPHNGRKRLRKTKEERAEERRALLEFERDSRSGRPFGEKEKTADERIVDELEDEESARRDTAAAEVGDSSTRTESADTLEAKPVFDQKALEKNKKRQIKNDTLLIEHRIYNDIRRLEMDTRTGDISFTAKIEDEKERRKRGKKKTALSNTRRLLSTAKKYENADNERYYRLVLTDVDEIKLPKSTDRDELRETRNKLLELLKRRDELNVKLVELYSISEGGKGKVAEGRFKAILNAKKTAYKKQLPTYKKYERAKISRADKEKLYPLLDERTELYGELARVNYALKKEKATGLAKKELKRERTKIMRKLDENRQAILHYERKALKRADKEAEKSRAAILGWSVLGVVAVGALLVIIFWNQIQPWLVNSAFPWIQQKFSQLVEWAFSLKNGGSAE